MAEAFPCLVLQAGPAMLGLRCQHGFTAQGGITALLNGITCGHLPLEGAVAPGQRLTLPLHRLPHAALPATLRFSTGAGSTELAAPWPLPTADAALALFGPGTWQATELRVAQGLLHGLLHNASNALAVPVLTARLNASTSRAALLGAPHPTAAGGALWPFKIPLLAEDLLESGLTLTLHIAGQDAPLATLAWARGWAGEEAQRLIALEARVQALERAAAAQAAALQAETRRRQAALREQLDTFLEFSSTLLRERAANTASPPTPEPADLAALRQLLTAAATTPPPKAAEARQVLPCTAPCFSFGWHAAEADAGGEFRWMMPAASLSNPAPLRPLAAVLLHVRHWYGGARPGLRAWAGSAKLDVEVQEAEGGYTLRLTPIGGPIQTETLRLESLHSGSPARDGASADSRELALAISQAVFDYRAGAAGGSTA